MHLNGLRFDTMTLVRSSGKPRCITCQTARSPHYIPTPTYGLAARRAADQWYARKQYPVIVDGLKKLFGLRGETPPPPDPDRIV